MNIYLELEYFCIANLRKRSHKCKKDESHKKLKAVKNVAYFDFRLITGTLIELLYEIQIFFKITEIYF